jgi:hemerythrin
MPLAALDRIPQVAVPFMNSDHGEFARRVSDLAEAVEGRVAGKVPLETIFHSFDGLLEHTREHFAREEAAMQTAGFPPFAVHKAEHDRVIEEMASEATHFRASADTARLCKYVTQTIPSWLVSHIQSMDYMTASFIAARS